MEIVRPLAGAGIEMLTEEERVALLKVRPLAGAGIEITCLDGASAHGQFAPSRGRELKSARSVRILAGQTVRPLAGAGLEITATWTKTAWAWQFAPSRGRELKSVLWGRCIRGTAVRPLAGAGIEIHWRAGVYVREIVRPLAGAGIEIAALRVLVP